MTENLQMSQALLKLINDVETAKVLERGSTSTMEDIGTLHSQATDLLKKAKTERQQANTAADEVSSLELPQYDTVKSAQEDKATTALPYPTTDIKEKVPVLSVADVVASPDKTDLPSTAKNRTEFEDKWTRWFSSPNLINATLFGIGFLSGGGNPMSGALRGLAMVGQGHMVAAERKKLEARQKLEQQKLGIAERDFSLRQREQIRKEKETKANIQLAQRNADRLEKTLNVTVQQFNKELALKGREVATKEQVAKWNADAERLKFRLEKAKLAMSQGFGSAELYLKELDSINSEIEHLQNFALGRAGLDIKGQEAIWRKEHQERLDALAKQARNLEAERLAIAKAKVEGKDVQSKIDSSALTSSVKLAIALSNAYGNETESNTLFGKESEPFEVWLDKTVKVLGSTFAPIQPLLQQAKTELDNSAITTIPDVFGPDKVRIISRQPGRAVVHNIDRNKTYVISADASGKAKVELYKGINAESVTATANVPEVGIEESGTSTISKSSSVTPPVNVPDEDRAKSPLDVPPPKKPAPKPPPLPEPKLPKILEVSPTQWKKLSPAAKFAIADAAKGVANKSDLTVSAWRARIAEAIRQRTGDVNQKTLKEATKLIQKLRSSD